MKTFCLFCSSAVEIIDNRKLKYLDIRPRINQPYKILPPEVESACHFDLNITQWVTIISTIISTNESQ